MIGFSRCGAVQLETGKAYPPEEPRELLDRVQPAVIIAADESLAKRRAEGLLEHREAISFDAIQVVP